MSEPIDNGGAAFPLFFGEIEGYSKGMSLRAWLAGEALSGVTALPDDSVYCTPNKLALDEWRALRRKKLAEYCVGMADAVIAALKEQP